MPAGKVGTGGIPDRGAALRTFVTGAVDNPDLQEPEENTGAAAQPELRELNGTVSPRLLTRSESSGVLCLSRDDSSLVHITRKRNEILDRP